MYLLNHPHALPVTLNHYSLAKHPLSHSLPLLTHLREPCTIVPLPGVVGPGWFLFNTSSLHCCSFKWRVFTFGLPRYLFHSVAPLAATESSSIVQFNDSATMGEHQQEHQELSERTRLVIVLFCFQWMGQLKQPISIAACFVLFVSQNESEPVE